MKLLGSMCGLGVALAIQCCAQAPAVVANPREFGDRTGRLKAGDMAPDFSLKVMHKETVVRLSAFRNQRPVALIFGSYT